MKVNVNGGTYEYEYGTTFFKIIKDVYGEQSINVLLVKCDGSASELHKTIRKDCTLEPIMANSPSGHYAYERSAVFIMLKAIFDQYPDIDMDNVIVKFSIANGLFIKVNGRYVDDEFASNVKTRMQDIVDSCIPITKKNVSTYTAIETFKMLGMNDKVDLFKYRRSTRANLYYLDNFTDYFYSYLVINTGYIKYFDLIAYEGGLVLVLPTINDPYHVAPFEPGNQLFNDLVSFEDYQESIGVSNVADMNKAISQVSFYNTVLIQEASMERRIGELAHKILSNDNIKIILIAGPSSSGKTTFSHRLSVQLESMGGKPYPIATDNYFVNREDTPLDKEGNFDFECLEAMDIDQFNKDMISLLDGNEVELPTFNFKSGKREYNGNYLQLSNNQLLVIEGIHCLDDRMVGALPRDKVIKIYIGPLSQINIDDHNLYDPNDARLLRRIVRDYRSRGKGAADTIKMWPSVRRGEELYIDPFRNNADVIFNSSLIYETSVIKPYAEALLFGIDDDDESFAEANRLLKILDYFLTISPEAVPNNSLLSEFIGGNIFNV